MSIQQVQKVIQEVDSARQVKKGVDGGKLSGPVEIALVPPQHISKNNSNVSDSITMHAHFKTKIIDHYF